ncbi:MAG: hypothetical protein Q8Q09_10395 [Deltaproteobacteria bacterium]|nr:hypothetical protein [Deltaproteobacteria bacterium]
MSTDDQRTSAFELVIRLEMASFGRGAWALFSAPETSLDAIAEELKEAMAFAPTPIDAEIFEVRETTGFDDVLDACEPTSEIALIVVVRDATEHALCTLDQERSRLLRARMGVILLAESRLEKLTHFAPNVASVLNSESVRWSPDPSFVSIPDQPPAAPKEP